MLFIKLKKEATRHVFNVLSFFLHMFCVIYNLLVVQNGTK